MLSKFLFRFVFFILLFGSFSLFAQEEEGEKKEEVKVPAMKQSKGVSKSEDLYTSAKSSKKNNKRLERKRIRKEQRQDKRDYKKLRKKQQNVKTTSRMRRNERRSNKINKEKEAPLFKRIFSKKSTERKPKKKDHSIKRKKKQKKVKNEKGFSRYN